MVINIHIKAKTGNFSYEADIADWLVKELKGCGKVDLIRVTIKYAFTKASDSIQAGICSALAAYTVEEMAGTDTGFYSGANTMNIGHQVTEELVVPDTISRQIQPPSAQAPGLRLGFSAGGGTKVWLTFYLKHHGPIRKHLTWEV